MNILVFYSVLPRIAKFVAHKLSQKWPWPSIIQKLKRENLCLFTASCFSTSIWHHACNTATQEMMENERGSIVSFLTLLFDCHAAAVMGDSCQKSVGRALRYSIQYVFFSKRCVLRGHAIIVTCFSWTMAWLLLFPIILKHQTLQLCISTCISLTFSPLNLSSS